MSAQANADALRKGYAAFSRGDMDELRNSLFSPSIVWHQGGRNQTSGDCSGIDAVLGLFAKLSQLTNGTFRVEVDDICSSETRAVALARTHATRAGKTLQHGEYSHVCTFVDGKIIEAWINVDPYAVDEFFA